MDYERNSLIHCYYSLLHLSTISAISTSKFIHSLHLTYLPQRSNWYQNLSSDAMFPPQPPFGDDRASLESRRSMLNGFQAYFMASFYPHFESEKMNCGTAATDVPRMDPTVVASRNHREAERRRRERIKFHLDRLRTILACDPKIDKASLLAKVVERMKDLKQRTEEITAKQQSTFFMPTETDEIVVLPSSASIITGALPQIFEASLCCDDRSDLLPDLIDTLRSLRLKTIRAEMATLGGRVRNSLVLAKQNEDEDEDDEGEDKLDGAAFLRDALKALVDRPLPTDRCKSGRHVLSRSSS